MFKMFKYYEIPEEHKETFIIDIDDDYETEIKKEDYSDYKIDINDPEVMEMRRAISMIQRKDEFNMYIDYYVHVYQGTLEQPYYLYDEEGNHLTAYSYYNYDKNNMVEIKLIFDEEQLSKVKDFLLQIGFVFDNLSFIKAKSDDGQVELGHVSMPHILLDDSGEEYYSYNAYNTDNQRMSQMTIVFDWSQYENVKAMLKIGNFII
jgi:hypothetical protein